MPFDARPFEFGDIVLVPFPFTDQSSSKLRPAVVISARPYNESKPDVILMPVTSQPSRRAQIRGCASRGMGSRGPLEASAIKPVIATLEQSLVVRRLGALESSDRAALKQGLMEMVG
jgi:mRNA interferase MazF